MSWMPGVASSSSVRIGRRVFVTNCWPGRGKSRSTWTRVCCAEWNSVGSSATNAHVSATCPPSRSITRKRRPASTLLRPFHPAYGVDVVEALSLVDYGDLPVAPGDTEGTYRRVEAGLAPLVEAGVFPLVLGGDHAITLAELRALAPAYGRLA